MAYTRSESLSSPPHAYSDLELEDDFADGDGDGGDWDGKHAMILAHKLNFKLFFCCSPNPCHSL